MMNRAEHLQWSKDRALEYLDSGDTMNAISSLIYDLNKHDETRGHAGIELTGMLMFSGHLDTVDKVRRHIEGFN